VKALASLGWIAALAGWLLALWLWRGKDLPPVVRAPEQASPAAAARPGVPADESESARIFREWSDNPELAGALVAFCLLDETGSTVFESPLAGSALCPASALKTVTTATALERLGPDFRFRTVLSGTGPVAAGVLDGDLLLKGSGDPTLATADVEKMVEDAANAGLKTVNGRILVSTDDYFDGPVNEHWNWGDIGNAYGAGAYRLNLDHNRITLRFRPGDRIGDAAALMSLDAATSDTRFVSEVRTAAPGSGDQVMAFSEPGGRLIRLRGTVPLGEDGFAVGAALPDPPARIREILATRLKRAGVVVHGRAIPLRGLSQQVRPQDLPEFAEHFSAPVAGILPHLHRASDNLEAQCLFHAIGTKASSDPSWTIRRHWEQRGVHFRGLRLIDGSGLARANMIRPLDLAQVNHLARRGEHGSDFRDSLASYLGDKVRSKLGAMSGVKTDVGFITLRDGREYTYALMANGLDPSLNFWPLREDLLDRLSR
jgi:D-alanyl-D-alanine carboxypeptidase/D-alanyl-D-alanine-endopeptidase (penicillin-binding protein 4)